MFDSLGDLGVVGEGSGESTDRAERGNREPDDKPREKAADDEDSEEETPK